MLKKKGSETENWNWQLRANRKIDDLEEEEEYLKNVERISHPTLEDSLYSKDFFGNSTSDLPTGGSTKESSIMSETFL